MRTTKSPWRTALVLVVCWTMMLTQMMQAALAATLLADQPIGAKVAAKPNIVYTVDDSGSMNYTFLPDYVTGNYCRSGNNITACSAIPLFNTTFYWPPVLSADFNRLGYDPNINYTPPMAYDGNPKTYSVGVVTDAQGNQANFTKVQRDPYLAPATLDNLTNKVSVLLYCNTDWPTNTTFGNGNGEYQSGTGDWCRINGTAYDVSVASGAPAVGTPPSAPYSTQDGGYNYPYQWSAAADWQNTKYFYRTITFKTIWCDTTSPKWPRNGTIIACSDGSTPTCGGLPCPTVQQKCNQKAKTCDPTVMNRTFTPAGCWNVLHAPLVSSDLYCKPNVGGSDGNSPGTGNIPECSACTCNATYQPAGGNCSITGAACNGPYGVLGGDLAECPNQPQAPNGCNTGNPIYSGPAVNAACNAFTWDPVAGVYTSTTLLQDANGNGEVCRHNNQTYAVGGVAGPFKYPAGTNPNPATYPGDVYPANASLGQTGAFNKAATSAGCPAITNPVTIPRHYYTIDSVQFCNGTDGTVDGPWKGFGTGVCQTKNDFVTYKYVKYGQFHRVDLVNDGRSFSHVDQATGQQADFNYATAIVNYANWYAYYRSRILATKTTSSIAFSYLDDTYRVGFHILGPEPAPYGPGGAITWTDVNDWVLGAGNQRDKWYQSLFSVAPTVGKTPTASAMLRIGNLFETGGAGGLPAEVNPLPATVQDPIKLTCQSNYHILFTDGFTNQVGHPTVAGNQDATIPASLSAANIPDVLPDHVMPNLRASGSPWMHPFSEAAPSVSDSLADIAMYYWARDLRPGMNNNVPAPSGQDPNDKDYTKDIAWWQHVNFNAISFGSEGVLDASNQAASISAVIAGTKNWTATTPNPWTPTNPAGNPSGGPSAVDDLWHAALNSRGKFVYANSPLEVSYGLANILAGIQNQRKSRAAAAFESQVLTASNNAIYKVSVEPGWAGDLQKVPLDLTTGAEQPAAWFASAQLKAQLDPVATGQTEPWFTNRRIVTMNSSSGAGVPFLWTNLSAAQKASLSPDPTTQQKMVAYLRGGNTWTGGPGPVTYTIEGTGIGQFRQRSGPLGDISNAQAAIVPPANKPYQDTTDPGYSGYKAAYATRSRRVAAAANDGMLHVFDADTGNEVFAYIPKALFRGVAGNVATQDVTALQALTYQDGGVPIFHHHFYVDSTPRVADVDFTNGGGDWHTILVGGLGKGGNSYYALDLTDPTAVDESAAAAKIMWEWTDPDVKYTYGRPVIVKVRDSAYPTGRWVVLVTASYNNPSGLGKIFVLDAKTGTKLSTFTTSAGTGANPSGLAQIHAFVKDRSNQIAEQIYGGDLFGNFWRVDVSAPDSYKSATPVLFARLTDPGGVGQPITTAPQIEIDLANGIDRYVFIGTGQLLDPSDLTTPDPPQQQTMYAIRDGTLTNIQTTGLPIDRSMLTPINGDGVSSIVGGAPNGWYDDLPSTNPGAERVVTDVVADDNIVIYIGTQSQNDPCEIALPATAYAREYRTARSLILDDTGTLVKGVAYASGALGATIYAVQNADGSQGDLGGGFSQENVQMKRSKLVNPVNGIGSRLTWRLLNGE